MHPARIPSQDEVLQFFRRAGFSSLTPFQEKLIPVLLNRRDAIAEAPRGAGTSSALAAPLVLGLRGAGPSLRALILLPTADDVARMARAFTRFTRGMRDAPSFVALGEPDDARRVQRRLEREGTVVAGTTGRVIDHIRRGGLSFGELETVIMRAPESEGRADFVKDVQFISAKWTERPRQRARSVPRRAQSRAGRPHARPSSSKGHPGWMPLYVRCSACGFRRWSRFTRHGQTPGPRRSSFTHAGFAQRCSRPAADATRRIGVTSFPASPAAPWTCCWCHSRPPWPPTWKTSARPRWCFWISRRAPSVPPAGC